MFRHGAAKVDWVTVWFLDWLVATNLSTDYRIDAQTNTHNWNAIVSPTEAFTLENKGGV